MSAQFYKQIAEFNINRPKNFVQKNVNKLIVEDHLIRNIEVKQASTTRNRGTHRQVSSLGLKSPQATKQWDEEQLRKYLNEL